MDFSLHQNNAQPIILAIWSSIETMSRNQIKVWFLKSLNDFEQINNNEGIKQIEFIIIDAFDESKRGKMVNTNRVNPSVYNESKIKT